MGRGLAAAIADGANQMTDPSDHDLFADYVDEDEMARMRDCSKRKLRNERLARLGPPYLKIDRKIRYPIAGFHKWLESITTQPVRANNSRPSSEVRP